jgi:hypothetical protein
MRVVLATILLAGSAATATAADNGFYLGAGAARSSFDIDSALDSKDTGLKFTAGLRLLDSFGVEASYTDHGKSVLPSGIACIALVGTNCPDTTNLKAKTTAAYAVGFLDFPLLDLFGKAGYSITASKLRTPNFPSFNDNDDKGSFAWGAGAQAHFGSLGVRAEYEQTRLIGNEKLGTVSVSFLYTFL